MNLRYFNGRKNFGDALSVFIVEKLTGEPISQDSSKPALLAVGSILDSLAKPNDTIWGTGLRGIGIFPGLPLKIKAVRGPLTRQLLLSNGIDCPAVFGDPALLLPKLYTPKQKGGAGVSVLPHYNDKDLFEKAKGHCDNLISVHDDPLSVVDAIVGSDALVTSSLHGLIVGEAYGVPTILLRHLNHYRTEPSFKYSDYFQSTGRDSEVLLNASVADGLKKIKQPPVDLVNLDILLEVFPKSL